MSDEILTSLEDDAAPVVPPPAPAAVAAPAEPAAPDPEKPAEVDAVEVGGQKYVPLGAVKAEREKRQAVEKEAARAVDLERQLNELRPYAEFVKANPQLLQPRPEPVAPAVPAPVADEATATLAKALDLYDSTTGQLDLPRAKMIRSLISSEAKAISDAAVQPLQARNAQEQSAMNFQRALQVVDADGAKPSEASLRAVWQSMPAADTADPRVAGILAMTALGMDRLTKRSPVAPPPQAPAVSEASGGNPTTRPALTDLEQRIAKERGMTQAAWQDRTKGFTRGTANTLED